MPKLVSITVLILLLGLPVATPLLAAVPCCPPDSATMLRPVSSCCTVSAAPETASPERIAVSPELAAPAPAGVAARTGVTLFHSPSPTASRTGLPAFLHTPLRI